MVGIWEFLLTWKSYFLFILEIQEPFCHRLLRKAKKEAELEKKLAESHNTKEKKDELTKEAKMELNRKAYEEWLEKKEEQLVNQDFLSRSLSTSAMNASLPPFYPTSRTISYRR